MFVTQDTSRLWIRSAVILRSRLEQPTSMLPEVWDKHNGSSDISVIMVRIMLTTNNQLDFFTPNIYRVSCSTMNIEQNNHSQRQS